MKVHRIKTLALCILVVAVCDTYCAQPTSHRPSAFVRWFRKAVWTVGLHGTVIDDDGEVFKKLFDVKHTWNSIWVPSKIDGETYIDKGFSAYAAFTVSRLKEGKIVGANGQLRTYNANVIAFDACTKYDLNELIGDTKSFSPYLIGGLGYTYRGLPEPRQKNGIMADFGAGCTVWFYKGFGFNAQSLAKFALNRGSHGVSNYLQHSIGVVYHFNVITGYRTPGRLGHRYNLFRN